MTSGTGYKLNNKLIMMVIIAMVIVIAAVIIIVSVPEKEKNAAAVYPGVEYIRTMEARDTKAIENEMYQNARQMQIEDIEEQVTDNPDLVWKYLNEINTVMMGDSRVVGFDVFGYMDENRVLAEGGDTIYEIQQYYDWLQVINPNLLVLSYGINDINADWVPWSNVYEYVDYLNIVMEQLTELLPDTYIYVQSIIPVNETGLATSPTWGAIPDWNWVISENCREMGWRYLDITDLIYDFWWCLEVDGVHLQTYFYPYWAKAILMRYINDSTP